MAERVVTDKRVAKSYIVMNSLKNRLRVLTRQCVGSPHHRSRIIRCLGGRE